MQHNDLLQKKNRIILLTYIVFFLVYMTTVMLDVFTFNIPYIISTCLFFVLIYLLKSAKASSRTLQYFIIISLNVLILLLISQSFYILNLYWLIFYLILIGFYQSNKLLIFSSICVIIEIFFFVYFKLDFSEVLDQNIKILFALATSMILIGIVQTIFIQFSFYSSDKKKQEEHQQLLSQQAYLQLFFEYANDSISVFDINNCIIDVNPAFEKLYGWHREECIGKPIPLVPPKRVNEAHERFLKLVEGESYTIESEEMKKDGTIFNAQISLSPLFNRQGQIQAISVITRDISFMKENERLKIQSEKLKLAGEIAAGVAHEIRNPMTVISGFIQMMQEDENSPFSNYANIVQDEIERIDLIISEFLVLSRPQIKEKQWVDLVKLLSDIKTFYELELKTNSITLELQTTLEEANILGNKNQLKQVFINLIKNSIEAISENGLIEIILSKKEKGYLISIKDNGCGITEEVLEHIFEPFYTTKSKGTGLGMMITNKIVQDHDGYIKIFSKVGKGTDIHVQFLINN